MYWISLQIEYSISIHALRGEGDWHGTKVSRATRISIHALRGEGDSKTNHKQPQTSYFNPRPPWGGRLDSWERPDLEDYISIHALRGEGDNNNQFSF